MNVCVSISKAVFAHTLGESFSPTSRHRPPARQAVASMERARLWLRHWPHSRFRMGSSTLRIMFMGLKACGRFWEFCFVLSYLFLFGSLKYS